MSTTSSSSIIRKSNSMTRLRPEGAEQDTLDAQEKSTKLKNSISNGSLDKTQQGCLPGGCNFTLDIRRRPISALAANSFWSGVSEIKDVLTTGNPLLVNGSVPSETAQFYVQELQKMPSQGNDDHFFEDISTLYQRQTALFQRSCEQLKDLYKIQEQQIQEVQDHQADANVSEFVLVDSKSHAIKSDETSSDADTLEGTQINYSSLITQIFAWSEPS